MGKKRDFELPSLKPYVFSDLKCSLGVTFTLKLRRHYTCHADNLLLYVLYKWGL